MEVRSANSRGYATGMVDSNNICGSTDADSMYSTKGQDRSFTPLMPAGLERERSALKDLQPMRNPAEFANGVAEEARRRCHSTVDQLNLDRLSKRANNSSGYAEPLGFRLNKLWGGLGRKESVSSSVSGGSGSAQTVVGVTSDVLYLRDALAKRNETLMDLQNQLDQFRQLSNEEREQSRVEIAQKNRRISELRETVDREREISENVTMDIKTIQRQIELKDNDIQRRDAFIRELRAKVNCLEHTMLDLREELDRKAEQICRLEEIRARFEAFERNFKVFPGYQVDRKNYSLTPISLILRMLPSACVYWVIIRCWDKTVHFPMSEIKSVSTIRIEGIEHSVNTTPSSAPQYKLLRPGDSSCTAAECLVIQNYSQPTITISFQSVEWLEAAVSTLSRMFKESQERERALHEEQKRICLSEMEAMMFGGAFGSVATSFPCIFESPNSL